MSRFSRPQPRSNPGCAPAALPPTHHQLPAASPQYSHHPSSPWNSLLASKTGTSIPKAAKSLSLQTAAGGAAPGPVQRGARVDTHKGPSPPRPSRGGNRGADRTRRRAGSAGGPGTRPLRHPIPQIGSPATALPASPLRQARGAGGPTSSSSPSSSAATLPSRRLMAPARPVRSPAARRAQNRSTPGDRRADSGETGRRRHKDAPQAGGARGRAGPPSPRAPDPPHGRALAGSEPARSVGRAAGRGDGGLGAETARCLLSWRRDHLVSPRQFWEDLLKDAVFGEAGGWIRRSPSLGPS